MSKIKSLLLVTFLSSAFIGNTALAIGCGCATGEGCTCAVCVCPNCC